jgi:hypothetical protein
MESWQSDSDSQNQGGLGADTSGEEQIEATQPLTQADSGFRNQTRNGT